MNKNLKVLAYQMKIRKSLTELDNELLCITYKEVKNAIDQRNKKGKIINL